MPRPISFEAAKARYPHRYTGEHVPSWARERAPNGRCYAPGFRNDREWYANTLFPGEAGIPKRHKHCETSNQSWPLGQWLDHPYQPRKGGL